MNPERPSIARILIHALTAALLLAACGGGGGSPPPPAPQPPLITSQPASATVADGATAMFSVVATGDAPLSYRWQRAGVDLVDGAGISGSGTGSMSVVAVHALNGTQYSVRVANPAGTVNSVSATLTVTPVLPTITTQPASLSVTAGANATFAVVVSGGTSPVTLQWRRNGTTIAGATSPSYTLSSAAASDNGASFAVDITNPAGTLTSSPALLSVTTPPKSWSNPVRISTNADNVDVARPRAAIDAAGNSLVVWRELLPGTLPRHGVSAARFDTIADWQSPTIIDNGADRPTGLPDVAMTPSGVGTAIFGQAFIGSFHHGYAVRYSGGVWQSPMVIEDHLTSTGYSFAISPQAPRVAMNADGSAVAVWNQGVYVVGHRSNAAGIWPLPAATLDGTVAPTVNATDPDIAVGANGIAFSVWRRGDALAGDIWFSRNAGAGWSVAGPLESEAGNVQPDAVVAVDAAGVAMALWTQQDSVSGRFLVRASRYVAGGWTAAATLSSSARDAIWPRVVVDANGNFTAAWSEILNQTGQVRSARFDAASATWSASQQVSAPGTFRCLGVRIAADAAGNSIVVWLQQQASSVLEADLYASASAANGAWSTPVNLNAALNGFIELGSYSEPALAMNADGHAVLIWHERRAAPATQGIWARVWR